MQIGSGHVMRCLTLAERLRVEGSECHFICRNHPGNLIDAIRTRGFTVSVLPTLASHAQIAQSDHAPGHAAWLGCSWEVDAKETTALLDTLSPDWLIVDHYSLAHGWESAVSRQGMRLMVIDDLADRPHQCELLLDQTLGRSAEDYQAWVNKGCAVLVGPEFALLRQEFPALRTYSLNRRKHPVLQKLLISMGGVDQPNATTRVLSALHDCSLPSSLEITVVMGQHAPWLTQVREQASRIHWPTTVLVNIMDMAKHMAESDLTIGAAGTTAWERCCLGLPALIVILAENQRQGALALQASGAALLINDVPSINQRLPVLLDEIGKPERLKQVALASSGITDGDGARRMTNILLKMNG